MSKLYSYKHIRKLEGAIADLLRKSKWNHIG